MIQAEICYEELYLMSSGFPVFTVSLQTRKQDQACTFVVAPAGSTDIKDIQVPVHFANKGVNAFSTSHTLSFLFPLVAPSCPYDAGYDVKIFAAAFGKFLFALQTSA